MHVSSRIVLNTASSWLAKIVSGVIGLLLVPFLLSVLGKEGYGIIVLVGVIVSMAAIADLGVRGAMSRHLAEQVALGNHRGFNELLSTGTLFFVLVGLVSAGVCMFLAPLLTRPFKVREDLVDEAVFLIRWYGSASILFSFLLPPFNAVIISNNRFDVPNHMATGVGIAQGLAIFAVLRFTGSGLYGWTGVMLAGMVIQLVLSYTYARRIWPTLEIRLRYVRRDALGTLFSLGGKLFLLQLSGLLAVHADPIVLSSILGVGAVALYKPAGTLSGAAQPLVNSLVDQLHPLATTYHATQRVKDLQAVLIRGTRYTLLMGIPVCIVLGILAEPITRIWLFRSLGTDYRITASVLMGWALIDLATYAGGSQWPVLLGMNRLNFVIATQLPLSVLNIVVSVLLVRYTSLGVVGVVIATIVIGIVRRPVIAAYTARVVGLRARDYFVLAYVRPLMVLVVLGGVTFGIASVVQINSLMNLMGVTCIVGLIWCLLCWLVGFEKGDRESFQVLASRCWAVVR